MCISVCIQEVEFHGMLFEHSGNPCELLNDSPLPTYTIVGMFYINREQADSTTL